MSPWGHDRQSAGAGRGPRVPVLASQLRACVFEPRVRASATSQRGQAHPLGPREYTPTSPRCEGEVPLSGTGENGGRRTKLAAAHVLALRDCARRRHANSAAQETRRTLQRRPLYSIQYYEFNIHIVLKNAQCLQRRRVRAERRGETRRAASSIPIQPLSIRRRDTARGAYTIPCRLPAGAGAARGACPAAPVDEASGARLSAAPRPARLGGNSRRP